MKKLNSIAIRIYSKAEYDIILAFVKEQGLGEHSNKNEWDSYDPSYFIIGEDGTWWMYKETNGYQDYSFQDFIKEFDVKHIGNNKLFKMYK